MAVTIPFGVKEGALLHISEAVRGLACACLCPECAKPLIARKGLVNEHHFAHAPPAQDSDCAGGVETALHRYAKAIIEEAGYLVLPPLKLALPPPDSDLQYTKPARRIEFTRVALEEAMAYGRRRIDVVGYVGERRLLIEICVTNKVPAAKIAQVKAAKDSMIEITVSQRALFSQTADGNGSLREAILDCVDNKRWLSFSKEAELLKDLQQQAIARQPVAPPPTPRPPPPLADPVLPEMPPPDSAKPAMRNAHMPSRFDKPPEQYVRELHEFILSGDYDPTVRTQIIKSLMRGPDLTAYHLSVADSLGLIF